MEGDNMKWKEMPRPIKVRLGNIVYQPDDFVRHHAVYGTVICSSVQ